MRGMLLFGAASALGFCSVHLEWLLPARVGQGIGAALAMPAGISLLSRHFAAEQQRMAFGIFGAFAAIGFAGGLALGGMIATLLNWHWIFGINVPVIGLTLLLGHRHIPTITRQHGSGPNGWMVAWLTLTLLVLSGAVHEAADLKGMVLPWLIGALVSGFLLLRIDRRRRRPFFGSDVYPSREAWRGLSAFTLLGASFLPFVFTCTLGLHGLPGQECPFHRTIALPLQHRIGAGIQSTLYTAGSGLGLSMISLVLEMGGGSGTPALLGCCAVLGVLALAALLILLLKPKKAYICTPI